MEHLFPSLVADITESGILPRRFLSTSEDTHTLLPILVDEYGWLVVWKDRALSLLLVVRSVNGLTTFF